MKIKQKLAFGSAVISFLTLGLILTIISYVIYQNAKKDATEQIIVLAENIALETKAYISGPLNEAYMLKSLLEKDGLLTRESTYQILNILTSSNESILGTYTVFEPNAFDGKDNLYRNTKYHDKTGRFIPYSVKTGGKLIVEPVVDYELPESDFYQLPKKTKKVALIPPFDYKVDGKDVTMISLVYPILKDQNFVGIAGADLSLETVRKYIQKIRILDGEVKISFIASNGYVIYNGLNPNSNETVWKNEEDKNVNLAKASGTKQVYTDSDFLHVSLPIQLIPNTDAWTLRISYPLFRISEKIQFIFWLSLILGLVGIGTSTIPNLLLFRKLVDRRLQKLIHYSEDVSKGDLNAKIDDSSEDEIGILIQAILKMTANIRHILSVAQTSGEDLSKSSKLMENTILELSDLAQSQAASSEQASATVEELNASSETINHNVEQAVTNTQSIHSSLVTIQNLVFKITNEVEAFGKIAMGANVRAEEGRSMASLTSKAIEEIQEKSLSITEFSEVISSISEKTSLLALNAAIEAARAGESGRGFAVVAEEISKLAAQAASSVSQINILSEEALHSIQNGGSQVERLIGVLRDITKEVSVIFEKAKEIVPMIQDQKSRTEEIYAEITEISSLILAIQQSTEEQKRATTELSNMTINISNGSQILSDQSNQMSENSLRMFGISSKLEEILKKFNI